MITTTYQSAHEFLLKTQKVLEKNEAANNLILGLCLRLSHFPHFIKTTPYFATIMDKDELVLAAVMIPPRQLVLYSQQPDKSKAPKILAQDLHTNHWLVPAVLGYPPLAKEFAATWTSVSGMAYREGLRQCLYELRKVISPPATSGRLRLATENELELVTQWAFAFQNEALSGGNLTEAREMAQNRINDQDIYLWEDKQFVSMAARSRPTTHGICISLVYTPPEFRGRGYATNCVAHLSQLLLDSGRKFCVLFTDLANPTSNHIYQSIAYTPLCYLTEYVFEGVV
jgi:predicted GNAT family acetyltransferase